MARGIDVNVLPESAKQPTRHVVYIADEPLVLRIEGGATMRVSLDSQPVQIEALQGVLEEQLAERPEKLVLVDADLDLQYSVVAKIMDLIQCLDARPVIVTPNSRNLVPQRSGHHPHRKG